MTNDSVQYLKRLLKKAKGKNISWDANFLQNLLTTESVAEIPGNPEIHFVHFASGRAKLRQISAANAGKRTYGTNNLIKSLSRLDQNSKIEFYNLENKEFRGTCFVQDEQIIGYEFVNRSGSRTFPGLKLFE